MIRSFCALLAVTVVTAAMLSCNNPACGPGTKQVQDVNGNLQCVPAEQPAPLTPCDVDGGNAEIVAGQCVSHIKCDPATTMYDPATGVCVGTGTGGGCAPCPSPVPPGQICLTGNVVDFQTGMKWAANTRPLRIDAYEPVDFLSNPSPTPLGEEASTTLGCYTLVVNAPATGLVALAVRDPQGAPGTPALALGGSGTQIVPGQKYNLDGYMVYQSTLDNWSAVNPEFQSKGAFVGCFFNQAPPQPTNQQATETNPATGVHLLEASAMPASAKYLKVDGTIDTTLTATGARGCGISTGNGITSYSGMGGGVTTWQSQPGGTTTAVVFVSRFHSCDGQPTGNGCP
jgi:hypothetical protein